MKNTDEGILSHSVQFFRFQKSPTLSPKQKDIKIDLPNNLIKFQSNSDNFPAILQLEKRIAFLEGKVCQYECMLTPKERKKKKLRRKAKQIPRIFQCQISNCGKVYGSQTSLKNHRKLKHGARLIRRARTQQPILKLSQKEVNNEQIYD